MAIISSGVSFRVPSGGARLVPTEVAIARGNPSVSLRVSDGDRNFIEKITSIALASLALGSEGTPGVLVGVLEGGRVKKVLPETRTVIMPRLERCVGDFLFFSCQRVGNSVGLHLLSVTEGQVKRVIGECLSFIESRRGPHDIFVSGLPNDARIVQGSEVTRLAREFMDPRPHWLTPKGGELPPYMVHKLSRREVTEEDILFNFGRNLLKMVFGEHPPILEKIYAEGMRAAGYPKMREILPLVKDKEYSLREQCIHLIIYACITTNGFHISPDVVVETWKLLAGTPDEMLWRKVSLPNVLKMDRDAAGLAVWFLRKELMEEVEEVEASSSDSGSDDEVVFVACPPAGAEEYERVVDLY